MKSPLHYFNIEDLVFDLTLLLIFCFLGFITPEGGILMDVFNPWVLTGIFIFMIFLAPWYLAGIYARYRERRVLITGGNWLARLAFFTGFVSSLIICFGIPVIILYGDHDIAFEFFAMFIAVAGIIAVIMGWVFGTRYREDAEHPETASSGLFSYFTVVMAIIGPFGGFFLVIAGLMNDSRAALVSGFALAAVYILISRKKSIFDRIFSSDLMRFYIFPFMLCLMMTFAHEILYNLIVFRNGGRTGSGLILSLVISGLLPVRVLLLFCPPVKAGNFIIGAGAFGFFIYQFI